MKRKSHIPADVSGVDFSGGKAKKAKKERKTRARKKAEKNAILPLHKRPIVCPPDRAGRSPLFRYGGLICRSLVIWLAAAGLVIFMASALEFGVPNGIIFLTALITVCLCTLFRLHPIGKLIAPVAAGGSVAALIAVHPKLPVDLFYGLLSMYNAALDRLYKVGYLSYVQYKAPIGTSTPHETLMIIGVCLLTVLISVLFTMCFCKRVRLIPPAIVATTILVVLLTFNIYSNRIESNLGIVLVMVSFASVLIMAAYDRLYRTKDTRRYDTELKLFEDSDRPTLPPEYEKEMADRANRKKAKAERRQKKRNHTVTVDDELTDYFSNTKKAKPHPQKSDKKQAKAQKQARREMLKQVRAVQSYDRVTEQSRTAMGGYASMAALLVCLLAIALPALFVKGNFNTIDAIDEKMELARDYVTALLRGDDDQLDRLEYQADSKNFKPHSTDLEQLQFNGTQIFYVQSRYNTNYYLRGWIGTDYEDGAWLAVDDETLAAYQSLFGKDSDPAAELKYGFYHFMKPDLVDDPTYTEHFLTKYKSNIDYGFVSLLVSLRRVNSPSTLTYFPSSYDPQYGVFDFNSVEASKLTFVNYYDGLYTGRKFHQNGLSYASVAYAPLMTSRNWVANQAALEAAYNLQKETLLARTGFYVNGEGGVTSYLTFMTEVQKNGMTMFVYTYKRGSEERIWRFYHDTDTVTRDAHNNYVVTTEQGTLTLVMSGSKIVGATVTGTAAGGLNLVDEYESGMTDAERTELMNFMNTEKSYSQFVYDTYLDTADSEYLRDLAATIKAQAHIEVEEIVTEVYEDDPETPEDDSFTYEHTILVDTPADVSLAAVRNSSDTDVYIQRDRLVRNVIDYIITEMGCEYTITPDLTAVDPTLDGVENFLRNTKEGYCVQFASAVTLILRELGIPARYVEGYIATGLNKISRDDFIYGGYVHDYEAHAWVEVYYDGVGWIQYETTPQYYTGMYGSQGSISGPTTPVLPDGEDTSGNDIILDPVETDELDTEADTGVETTNEDDEATARLTRNSLIGLGILILLGTLFAIIYTIVSRARAAEDHRQSIAAQILENGFGHNTSEEDRREMALEITDAVTDLLGFYGLSPKPGEFGDDYADRLTAELTAPVAGQKPRTDLDALPNLHAVMEGMAAEEFGHGMTVDEMKQMAALYLFLRRDIRQRIALPDRLKLRYVKRKI